MLLIFALTAASFLAGVFANQVIVNNIQSLAGNHSLVPAPELVINSTSWIISLNSSTVTGVTLNVITVSPNQPLVTKLYQIFIQVSCLAGTGEFTCATGSTTVTLPSNGGSAILFVPISPQIDPELTEIHDLSFIVTGTPTPTPIPCTPSFSITAVPKQLTLSSNGTSAPSVANVTKTITSLCGFSGNMTLNVNVQGPGKLSIFLSSNAFFLPSGGTVTVVETINARGSTQGTYTITNTVSSPTSIKFASATVTVNVGP